MRVRIPLDARRSRGGTGRHARLKPEYPQGYVGSTPTVSTRKANRSGTGTVSKTAGSGNRLGVGTSAFRLVTDLAIVCAAVTCGARLPEATRRRACHRCPQGPGRYRKSWGAMFLGGDRSLQDPCGGFDPRALHPCRCRHDSGASRGTARGSRSISSDGPEQLPVEQKATGSNPVWVAYSTPAAAGATPSSDIGSPWVFHTHRRGSIPREGTFVPW